MQGFLLLFFCFCKKRDWTDCSVVVGGGVSAGGAHRVLRTPEAQILECPPTTRLFDSVCVFSAAVRWTRDLSPCIRLVTAGRGSGSADILTLKSERRKQIFFGHELVVLTAEVQS